jgi:hypothetical protein
MRRTLPVLALGLLLALAAGGCGGDGENGSTTTTAATTPPATTTAPAETTALRVYFLRDGKVAAVGRTVPSTQAVAAAALAQLSAGPTAQERRSLGLSSAVSGGFSDVSVSDGVARPEGAGDLSQAGLAQVVYTLTQFPGVKAVEIGGSRLTRADFEDLTPAILVESPLPFETVSSPLRATGTANTFEATFNYELTDADGEPVAKSFVTATSGSGTRGTFDFTAPFHVERPGSGELVVFEISAEDGSRTKVVRIPLRLG